MRQRLLAFLLAAALAALFGCGPEVAAGGGTVSPGSEGSSSGPVPPAEQSAPPSQSPAESLAPPPEPGAEVGVTSGEDEAAMEAMALDFAVHHRDPFESTQGQVNERFVFLQLYEDHPEWEDESGSVWVPMEEFTREVWLRYGIEGYRFQSPARENVYPRYVEEKGAIAFYPAGCGISWVAEQAGAAAQGDLRAYTIDLYNDFITDGHEERTWERRLRYTFRMVRRENGEPVLQAISARELPFLPRSAFGEEETRWIELAKAFCVSDVTVGEGLTDREKASFFQYIISTSFYRDQLPRWQTAEGGYVIPLADIREILFTHLDTDTFDPAGFPAPNQWQGYDEGSQSYRMEDVGGYGGARALEVLEYTQEEGRVRIVLGLYDMEKFFGISPDYRLVDRWETELLLGEGERDFRVVKSGSIGLETS